MPGLRREEVASLRGEREYYNAWSAATPPAPPMLSLRRSPTRCGSTTPSAPTSSTSRAPRARSPRSARAPGAAAPPTSGPAHPRQHRPPAAVSNVRCDYLAANQLGRALYAPLFDSREQPPNSARFTFLDPAAQEFFARLGEGGQGPRRNAALPGRAQPLRPRPVRPRRRAVDPERSVPQLVGRTQRPLPPHRNQAAAPSHRRRARTQLRGDGTRRRCRTTTGDLHRRTRQPLRGGAQPPRQLGRHARARTGSTGPRQRRAPLTTARVPPTCASRSRPPESVRPARATLMALDAENRSRPRADTALGQSGDPVVAAIDIMRPPAERRPSRSSVSAFSNQWSANGSSLNAGTSTHPVDR